MMKKITVSMIILFLLLPIVRPVSALGGEPRIWIGTAEYVYIPGYSSDEQFLVTVDFEYVEAVDIKYVSRTSKGASEIADRYGTTFYFRCNGTIRFTVKGFNESVEVISKEFTINAAGIQSEPSFCEVPPGEEPPPPVDPPLEPENAINGDGTEKYEDLDGSKEDARQSGTGGDGSGDGSGTGGDTSGGTTTNEGCIGCEIFYCPGWGEYMGKVNQIISAIPPAPNWEQVATTFSNTIVPALVSDMGDLLGNAPTPPAAPTKPTAPSLPDNLNDGGITPPTGEEAPGLEESTFTENDIKNEAPLIEEREDQTGGFIINDPLSTLPTQEEFKQNIPNEGVAPIPAAPREPENIAPTPVEPENIAPTPVEPENIAPTPTEQENTAPQPTDDSSTAPLPGDTTGGCPMPGDTTDTAPTPTADSSTAPLPSDGTTETTTQ